MKPGHNNTFFKCQTIILYITEIVYSLPFNWKLLRLETENANCAVLCVVQVNVIRLLLIVSRLYKSTCNLFQSIYVVCSLIWILKPNNFWVIDVFIIYIFNETCFCLMTIWNSLSLSLSLSHYNNNYYYCL